jgi:hypothetical protein
MVSDGGGQGEDACNESRTSLFGCESWSSFSSSLASFRIGHEQREPNMPVRFPRRLRDRRPPCTQPYVREGHCHTYRGGGGVGWGGGVTSAQARYLKRTKAMALLGIRRSCSTCSVEGCAAGWARGVRVTLATVAQDRHLGLAWAWRRPSFQYTFRCTLKPTRF